MMSERKIDNIVQGGFYILVVVVTVFVELFKDNEASNSYTDKYKLSPDETLVKMDSAFADTSYFFGMNIYNVPDTIRYQYYSKLYDHLTTYNLVYYGTTFKILCDSGDCLSYSDLVKYEYISATNNDTIFLNVIKDEDYFVIFTSQKPIFITEEE